MVNANDHTKYEYWKKEKNCSPKKKKTRRMTRSNLI